MLSGFEAVLLMLLEGLLMFSMAKKIVPLLKCLMPRQVQTTIAALHTVYRFNGSMGGIF
jgi:hypothetical protein